MAIQKDSRYEAVKSLIEKGRITSLQACFKIIPLTVVRIDAQMHYATFHRRVYKPALLTLENIIRLAELFEVEPCIIVNLAAEDFKNSTKHKKKKL